MTVATSMKRVSGWLNEAAQTWRAARPAPDYDSMVREAERGRTAVHGLPAFGPDGKLPAGIHDADLGSFLLHVGTNQHRRDLYGPFASRLLELRDRGVREVYAGGSGISAKAKPGDVDALFHVDDASRLPVHERLEDWLSGTHWHGAERRHFAPHTNWGLERPTWLQYFSQNSKENGAPTPVVRILLNDAPQAAVGASQLAR